jgi:hypothetical protein
MNPRGTLPGIALAATLDQSSCLEKKQLSETIIEMRILHNQDYNQDLGSPLGSIP